MPSDVASVAPVTPETCRRFFHERRDVSLGLVPQLLLDEPRADLWAYLWYAARQVDDAVEEDPKSVDAFRGRLRRPAESPAELALARFLDGAKPVVDRDQALDLLDAALEALAEERAWTQPPAMADYVRVVIAKAGTPLYMLHRLLLPGEEDAAIVRFTQLLALSIQLGDDARDLPRDRERGLQTITREEVALAESEYPEDPDAVTRAILPRREAAAQWFALQGLECAERFQDPNLRQQARLEALLWLRAIDAGQIRDRRHPLRWPSPLGELLEGGPPTLARMAACRRVLQNDPAVLSVAGRWDARRRMDALQEIRKSLPDLYLEMGQHLRPGLTPRPM